ncbi:Odorant receptor [Operophtera brumata]|uniref:Odorant receptor n=1 Tax=Operophtera brumata TaxID=104452 RepID=A0A0L7LHR5_OPEBR|nr:Odorant receptor [Operophtera brumata]
MLAISTWTGQVPRRPALPLGAKLSQLMALGSRRDPGSVSGTGLLRARSTRSNRSIRREVRYPFIESNPRLFSLSVALIADQALCGLENPGNEWRHSQLLGRYQANMWREKDTGLPADMGLQMKIRQRAKT